MTDRTASSINIEVPRADIMAVIADFAAYPEWADAIRSADVLKQHADGRPAEVRFTVDAGIFKDSYVLGYEWDGDEHVRWHMTEAGSAVNEMTGSYQLTERGDGTEVAYELAVGSKMPMFGMIRRKAEKAIIGAALTGLKTRAETLRRGS
jgi:hypothetical protein